MVSRSCLSPAERELYSRLRQLLERPGLIRGSVVIVRRTCGKGGCRCQKARRQRHRALYLGLKINGKQHMVYVPAGWEDRVQEWASRYAEIRGVLERLSVAFLKRLRSREA